VSCIRGILRPRLVGEINHY
ncbi:hypothetical protein MIMGU_mgv1a0100952mg, partial [Erythranthe guttata]